MSARDIQSAPAEFEPMRGSICFWRNSTSMVSGRRFAVPAVIAEIYPGRIKTLIGTRTRVQPTASSTRT